jgi:acetoin utilization protein AcuC
VQPVIVYDTGLDAYDLAPWHPLRPQRVTLALGLLDGYALTSPAEIAIPETFSFVRPRPIDRDTLLLAHDPAYIEAVERASADPSVLVGHGIGPGDTPAFSGMHEAAALVAGATWTALDLVVSGRSVRAFAPAGGLHHAHRDHAAGFCVYNDAALAITSAIVREPDLRIAYIDIDAHHGDGVQEAFYAEPRVLTISLHEDGRYLYPGTGSYRERGEGAGAGATINVPMPPHATPECYLRAFDRTVAPAVRAFGPDVLVTQNGVDAHWSDPLTSLGMTIPGYEALFGRLVALAEETTSGRLVALGGGGYSWRTVVPRAWALLGAALLGVDLPDTLPERWMERVREYGAEPPSALRDDPGPTLDQKRRELTLRDTEHVVQCLAADLRS